MAQGTARREEASRSSHLSPLNAITGSCEIMPIARHMVVAVTTLQHMSTCNSTAKSAPRHTFLLCSNPMGLMSVIWSGGYTLRSMDGVVD